jgi:hypothetical protein
MHKIKEHEDCSDREWFRNTVQDGKLHVSGIISSRITGALIMTVSAPVVNDDDDMIGVLGLDIRFEDVVKVIQNLYESRGMNMTAQDLQKYQKLMWLELHKQE